MGSDIIPDAELDCVGLYCPIPIVQTKEEIDKLEINQVLKVEADDPAAEEDIMRGAKRIGHEIMKFEQEGTLLTFYIRKIPNQGIQPKLNTCGWCLSLAIQIKT